MHNSPFITRGQTNDFIEIRLRTDKTALRLGRIERIGVYGSRKGVNRKEGTLLSLNSYKLVTLFHTIPSGEAKNKSLLIK